MDGIKGMCITLLCGNKIKDGSKDRVTVNIKDKAMQT